MRIMLFILVIFLIWLGIKIMVRALPELFSNSNRRKLNDVGGRLPIIGTDRVSAVAKIFLLLNVAPALAGSVARREQVNILKKKIRNLYEREKLLSLIELKHLPAITKPLDDQLESWSMQIARNEFEFVDLRADVDRFAGLFQKYADRYVEADVLLAKCFELLKRAAEVAKDDADLNALSGLEKEFDACSKAIFSFGQISELDDLVTALKEKEKILLEFVSSGPEIFADNKSGGLDYYAILGVSPTADAQEITAAYRREIKRWHPDVKTAEVNKIGDPDVKEQVEKEFERRFREAREAYEVLSDATKRTAYDQRRK